MLITIIITSCNIIFSNKGVCSLGTIQKEKKV